MSAELEVTVVQAAGPLGYVARVAVADDVVYAAGGTSSRGPIVLASSDGRRFARRATPRELGLRGIAAFGGELWACGEYGQLARSRDRGATWTCVAIETDACLLSLAAIGGELWACGERGTCVRVRGDLAADRVDLATADRLVAIYNHAGDVVIASAGGALHRRERDGTWRVVATAAASPLTDLAITKRGTWIVVGDRGFISRSPDGAWFSRAASGVAVDLEAVATLADGRVVAVGAQGTIAISADDGRTWHAQPAETGAHLWSVARFGDGALIGGDDGWIGKLAAPGDATWAGRADVFDADLAPPAWDVSDLYRAAGEPPAPPALHEDEGDNDGNGDDDDSGDDDGDDDDDDGGDDDGDGDGDPDDFDTDGEVYQTAARRPRAPTP